MRESKKRKGRFAAPVASICAAWAAALILVTPLYAAGNGAFEGLVSLANGGFGTPENPYAADIGEGGAGSLSGEQLNAMRESGTTWLFTKKDVNGKLSYSWRFSAAHMTPASADTELRLGIILSAAESGDGLRAVFEHAGALPGEILVTLNVEGLLPNAAVARLEGPSGGTAAIVSEGRLAFVADETGAFNLTDSGKTLRDLETEGAKADADMDATVGDNEYTNNGYRGKGFGTEAAPLTILGDLSKPFQASWKSMNTVAGFAGGSYSSEDSYDSARVMKAMVEYRDPVTGRLRCSVYIDGVKWRLTTETEKGPYYMDYRLNPDASEIRACLEGHSLYTENYAARLEPTLEALNAYAQSDATQLLLINRTREFAGPLVYRLDVSNRYDPGDAIDVEYLLGAANGHLYHGEKPSNASLLLLEPSYSKYDVRATVDDEGYLAFTVYNGGFFALTKSGNVKPLTKLDADYHKQNPGDGAGSSETADAGVRVGESVVSEWVQPDTESRAGVIESAPQEAPSGAESENFRATSEDGNITLEGLIRAEGLRLDARETTENHAGEAEAFAEAGAFQEAYSVFLYREDGSAYTLSDGEYLRASIRLRGAYGINDLDSLTVRAFEPSGNAFRAALSDERFVSESNLDEEGRTTIEFQGFHPGRFAILRTEEAGEASGIVVQEHDAVRAASLAERLEPSETDASPVVLIVMGSVLALAAGAVASDRRFRRREG
jgi:hypothetical protein